ncbi:hypothetical protein NW766_001836 [Fusarium irregulare]|uniref:Uncharacterized protein n=1 Tax=Fusarium irregulare TaxID=2494466 RepID=A0A9W8UEY8_9HYPO|nr:hypothetical protein NW766_001836 [Fusarium irregulare]
MPVIYVEREGRKLAVHEKVQYESKSSEQMNVQVLGASTEVMKAEQMSISSSIGTSSGIVTVLQDVNRWSKCGSVGVPIDEIKGGEVQESSMCGSGPAMRPCKYRYVIGSGTPTARVNVLISCHLFHFLSNVATQICKFQVVNDATDPETDESSGSSVHLLFSAS